MVETIFSWPIFSEVIFPFVLVFTLLFAILEKTEVIGKNKQNHALISLAVALILVATPARSVITSLAPFFAVLAVVLLIFMLLWGFVLQDKVKIEGSLKTLFLIVIIVSVAIAVLSATGYWEKIINLFKTDWGIVANIIILVVIGVAAFVIVKYSK
ncbi:MAG: hypothetical protein QW041_03710 [Candidatus Pacearchaeota archaeon]